MLRSGLKRQSANLVVVVSSPAGGEKWLVGQTLSGWIFKRFTSLATHFTPPKNKLGTKWIV